MEEFFDKAEDAGVLAGFPTDPVAMAHALGGGTILVLMLVRLGLRLAYGAPPPPASLTPVLQLASRVTHYAFYVLLIALPATGMTALYLNSEAGDVHVFLDSVADLHPSAPRGRVRSRFRLQGWRCPAHVAVGGSRCFLAVYRLREIWTTHTLFLLHGP